MPDSRVRVLLNPKAGAGSSLKRLAQLRAALRRHGIDHDIAETSGPGDASRLAAVARDEGVELLAVIGGDGTLNEVAQAYVDPEGQPVEGPEIAIIPAGTGGDYRRTVGLSDSLDDAVERLRSGASRRVDLGVVRLKSKDRRPVLKAFLNVLSFGIGGVTDQLVNDAPKWLGGKPSFFLGTVRALASYRNIPVRVSVDGVPFLEAPIFNVAVALGRFHGGGMMIAPDADPSDGLFDIVALADLSTPEVLGLTRKIYQGKHLGARGVHTRRGKVLEAEPVHPWASVLIDMDGETPGQLPIAISILPGALRLRA